MTTLASRPRSVPLLMLAVALGLAAAPAAGDWPLFRGNAMQTGRADVALPDKLEVLWQFKGQAKDSIAGAPAVVAGTVYVGSEEENLYALDLASGKEKWRYNVPKSGFRASPAVYKDAVY